jgi:hypothetical protein
MLCDVETATNLLYLYYSPIYLQAIDNGSPGVLGAEHLSTKYWGEGTNTR